MNADKLTKDSMLCREIVKDISLFEISQRQRKLLIYMLALEIEDIELMRAITDSVKELANDVFISSCGEKDGT